MLSAVSNPGCLAELQIFLLFLGPRLVPETLKKREPSELVLSLGSWGVEFWRERFLKEEVFEAEHDCLGGNWVGVEFAKLFVERGEKFFNSCLLRLFGALEGVSPVVCLPFTVRAVRAVVRESVVAVNSWEEIIDELCLPDLEFSKGFVG